MLRYGLLYFVAGVYGTLASAVFLPQIVMVGAQFVQSITLFMYLVVPSLHLSL